MRAAQSGPTVSISASPGSITAGKLGHLTVNATNATGLTVAGTDGSSIPWRPPEAQ